MALHATNYASIGLDLPRRGMLLAGKTEHKNESKLYHANLSLLLQQDKATPKLEL